MTAAGVRAFFISLAAIAVMVLIAFLCGVLPESPFQAFLKAEEVCDFLGAINYFVPVDSFITIGSAWLLAIVPWLTAQFAVTGVKILGEFIPFT